MVANPLSIMPALELYIRGNIFVFAEMSSLTRESRSVSEEGLC